MNPDIRSWLCPEHRNDGLSSCVACAQARRIAELEQTVEELSARVEVTEPDASEADRQNRRTLPSPAGEKP